MLYTMTRTRCHSGPRAEAHLPFARDSSHTLMVLTDLGTEPSVGELWSDMMKRATKLTLLDRKSTRLNSSHVAISYAVFCLKKKKTPIKKRMRITNTAQRHE